MMIFTLLVSVLIFSQALAAGYENGVDYSVKCAPMSTKCELVKGKIYDPDSHAWGSASDDVNADGWVKLWAHGDATEAGWYQAGFLEGALTSQRIYQHFVSWYDYQFGAKPPSEALLRFLNDQFAYARELAASGQPGDQYYSTLLKLLHQFQGLLDGQNHAAAEGERLSLMDLLLLEAAGDLYDIIPATDADGFQLHIGKLSKEEFHDRWHRQISCSALVKLSADKQEVLAGHTSWTTYQSMLRVFKHYNMDGGAYQSSHSSKPGLLYSKDDFYVLPRNQLVVMETTNGVLNPALYDLVTPQSLLTWQRLPVTNALAASGRAWTDTASRHSSGTYANMWMVVDMKLFVPGRGPAPHDFLWIVEQAPGLSVAQDVTATMLGQGGYWPSYNIPYDRSVYVMTGFQQAFETYGDQYSYANCTRGLMSKRDEGKVQDEEALKRFLRYNDYQQDPLSAGNAAAAISARYDLRTSSPKTYGGVDSKVTTYSRVMGHRRAEQGVAAGEVGPSHDDLPPFRWSTSPWASQVHLGQPDLFDFGFVEMHP